MRSIDNTKSIHMMNNCRGSTSRGTNNTKKEQPSFDDQDADMLMRPTFIKIIHSYIIENQKLRIPAKFVSKYGEDFLSDIAILTVPDGSVWSVDMKSNSDAVWFGNGLNKFFDYFSILPGHLLMFRYDGNCQFHVVIFDTSASEIAYPFNNNNENSYDCDDDECPSEETDTSWEEDQTDDKDSQSDSSDISSPSIEDDDDDSSEGVKENVIIAVNKKKKKKMMMMMMKKEKNFYDNRSGTSSTLKTQKRANRIAKEFKSEYPFFTVALQPSYIHHKYLPIPTTFKEKHLLEKLKYIRFEVVDGQAWRIGLLPQSYEGTERVRFSKGVAKFLKGNNLVEGDICVFQMKMRKKSSKFKLVVHIFRRPVPREL